MSRGKGTKIAIWRFPKIGVPLNHPFFFGIFHNHPAIYGLPPLDTSICDEKKSGFHVPKAGFLDIPSMLRISN